ncbi:MAG: TrkH family potassium uptake protein [Deinococcota bacterium]
MRGRFAPYILGTGLLGLAVFMAIFTLYAGFEREPWRGFLITAVLSGVVGRALTWWGTSDGEPTRREALVGVIALWFVIPFMGAFPYMIDAGFSPINAMFESMSGFTTTGATVLTDFDALSPSLFMWRALTQWVGGVGIIVLFIAVFPKLAIAGRQLFFAEAPGPTEERLTPRLKNTSNAVLLVYVGLTVLCIIAYRLGGMGLYDAIAHAFTTLSAGGFSPKGLSFEEFSPTLVWICIIFMVFAGSNFALQYRVVSGKPKALLRDSEFRAYLIIIAVVTVVLTFALRTTYAPVAALRHALFQVLSIMTTAGYASADFALWPQQAQVLLIVLMFVGGSAGSAGGGIKVARWLIITKHTVREVRRALQPRAVLPLRVGGRSVPEEVFRAVAAFVTLYVGLFAFTTAILVWFGADFTTAFTASIACIGNIGPGLNTVGPMLNFDGLHPFSRVLLTFGMYAGRLEVVTLFVLFDPAFWRLPRVNLWRSKERS